MLAVFFGNDTIKVRQKAYNFAEAKKVAGSEIVRLAAGEYEGGRLVDMASAVSLFDDQSVVIVDSPAEDDLLQTEITDSLESLQKSPHIFVVIEGTLLATEKKVYQKHADVLEEYKKTTDERFNNFALADALLKKDKKLLWLLLNEARLSGTSDEEIAGVLWWQLKTMRLAMITDSAEAAGMKDYSYSKAKRSLPKFADGEVESLSQKLLTLLHDSRQGRGELDVKLEQLVLSV